MSAIVVEQASKVFGDNVHALRGASFEVKPGARACLLGPNGAGKTTLVRLLTGALRPSAGRVQVLGAEVQGPRFVEAKQRMGIVPQSPGMYRNLSVREYLTLVQSLYARGSVPETAARLGLTPFLDRPMSTLSGGWQRKLVLAAALLPMPELLLLDEPTAGLDPVAAREVLAILREHASGRTVLMCTHNLAEAEALCDQVIILRSGAVLLQDALETLRRRQQPSWRLRATGERAALLQALSARGLVGAPDGEWVRVTLEGGEHAMPPLLRGLLDEGISLVEVRREEGSLETAFFDALGGVHAKP